MNPIQKQAFQLRPMADVVPVTKDDLQFMVAHDINPHKWGRAQKVADDAINKASKASE